MVRRKLHISATEWADLPWWEAELLVEGLIKEAESLDEASGQAPRSPGMASGQTVDLANADLGTVGGFQHRVAG